MARWAREHGLWLTLAGLAVLLVALAALQYRWIGELGRAYAERRQSQLARSAARFAMGVDRELGRAGLAFRLEPGPAGPARSAGVAARLASWQQDEHAALVSRVRLVSIDEERGASLESCTIESCRPEPWPAELEALRARLAQQLPRRGPGQFLPFRQPLLAADPETLLVPLLEPNDGEGRFRRPRYRINGLVLLELDMEYLRERLLPQIAEASLGEPADSDFVVALVRRRDRALLYTTDETQGRAAAVAAADVTLPAPFGMRRERSAEPGEPPPFVQERFPPAQGTDRRPHEEDLPWLVLARHRAGSLERTVAAMRRRNLAAGLGVLALLGAAGAMLATGASRARQLARQQLQFVAGVTHELNTPLAAIRSAGQNLADGIVKDPQQVSRYGSMIEKEGSRLSSLVAQVLDFAGIDSGARAYAADRLSVADVVDGVLADMRLALEQSGLAVRRQVDPDTPAVTGDAAALRRVLANLLANAIKFAASGGEVTVRVEPGTGGRSALLRVEDRGPGIPAAERARVFEPFFRGGAAQRNETPGSGLGLSLVRRVVLAHGGRVRLEEPARGGAAVVVELPAAPATEAEA